MNDGTIPEQVRTSIRDRLARVSEDDILHELCSHVGLCKHALNPAQALDLFFSWFYQHECRHSDASASRCIRDYIQTAGSTTPLGIYIRNNYRARNVLALDFPTLQYSSFGGNMAYADCVSETYPLLDAMVPFVDHGGFSRIVQCSPEENRRLLWAWIMTPSFGDRNGLCTGRMTVSLRKTVDELARLGIDRKALVRALYTMVRTQDSANQ
jgi:hypothetical protein